MFPGVEGSMSLPKEWRRMSKRRFLKNLSKIGVSAQALKFLDKKTTEALTENPGEDIPRLKGHKHTNHQELVEAAKRGKAVEPELEPVYYTIPRDEWIASVAPWKAAKELENSADFIKNDDFIKAGVTSRVSGQRRERVVVLTRIRLGQEEAPDKAPKAELEQIREEAPTQVDTTVGEGDHSKLVKDIPVIVKEKKIEQYDVNYNYEYRPVPGGCQEWVEGAEGFTTLGTPVYDRGTSDNQWLTAGHNGSPNDDVNQPSSEKVGWIFEKEDTVSFDAATIERDGADVKWNLAGNSGPDDYTTSIQGTLAWDTIQDQVGHMSYDIHRQGHSVSRNSGHIVEASTDKTFWIEADSAKGDSGSPAYRVEINGGALIAGIQGWGRKSGAESGFTHISKILDKWNLVI